MSFYTFTYTFTLALLVMPVTNSTSVAQQTATSRPLQCNLQLSAVAFVHFNPVSRPNVRIYLYCWKGRLLKFAFISDSVPKGGAQPQFQTPNYFSKKALKGPIQWITMPTCTYHLIFMFNLLVPQALADIIDENGTMEEQSLNNCRQESCVVSGLFS